MEATQDDTGEEYEIEPEVKLWGRLIPNHPKWNTYELSAPEYVIGRDASADIVINQKVISGRHCRIFRDSNVVFLEDLSTNGTFINSEPKLGRNKKKILSSGAKITISKFNSKAKTEEISYIYTDVKDDAQDQEKGGPFGKYHVAGVLGCGAFATVKLAYNKETNEKVALKIISKKKCATPEKRSALEAEVEILQKMDHKGVIKIIECFNTESNLYLVLELVTGGELFDLVSEKTYLTEEQSHPLMRQMLEVISYLHENGIAHRDLKLENVLLTDEKKDTIKISDFGLSRIIGDGNFMKTICGTPEYLAPEVLNNKQGGYSIAVDIWSLGVIFYTMLFGVRPFEGTNGAGVFDRVANGTYEIPSSPPVSEEAKDLLVRMLTVDVNQRITALQALHHPWIKGEKIKKGGEVLPPPSRKASKVPTKVTATSNNNKKQRVTKPASSNNNNNNNNNSNWKKRSLEDAVESDEHPESPPDLPLQPSKKTKMK